MGGGVGECPGQEKEGRTVQQQPHSLRPDSQELGDLDLRTLGQEAGARLAHGG